MAAGRNQTRIIIGRAARLLAVYTSGIALVLERIPINLVNMSLTLYLLRHGETTHSQSGGFCGSLDPGLTDAGLAMAEAFAEAYADVPWQAVYASPMTRTRQTAAPLCQRIGREPIVRDGLKEMHFGDWE